MLVPTLAKYPEALQPTAEFRARRAVLVRQPIPKRAVRETKPKLRRELRAQTPRRQVLERLGALLQRLLIVGHDALQQLVVASAAFELAPELLHRRVLHHLAQPRF